MENQQRFALLFQKYLKNSCSPEEVDQFMELLSDNTCKDIVSDLLESQLGSNSRQPFEDEALAGRLEQRLQAILRANAVPVADMRPQTFPSSGVPDGHRHSFLKMTWYRYAAIVLLVIGAGAYFWLHGNNETEKRNGFNVQLAADIPPGKDGAILTLEDGSRILLDSTNNKIVAVQNGSRVLLKNGRLSYEAASDITGKITYNTMTTPRGKQFRVILPDGTGVWLNAESTVRYPTSFTGSRREVQITGEAYFEVAKDPARPFIVKVNNAAIEVLGTSFNVMAYPDEDALKTTLLEGSVKFINDSQHILLKPGQQSWLLADNKIRLVKDVDTDMAIAWKNGVQAFNGADIKTIMRQVERWYDIEVVYNGALPERTFSGDIPRTANLSALLKLFEVSKIHFSLDKAKKKLTIMP